MADEPEVIETPVVEEPVIAEVAALGDMVIKAVEKNGDLYLCVDRSNLLPSLKILKESSDLAYTFFSECVGVDYSTWTHPRDLDGRFEVVYNLLSIKLNKRIFVKTSVNDGETIPTARHLYLGAEYPEKEIGDLYGIVFEGNALAPGSRFLLPDDWVGHPLRKEYPLGGEDVLFDKGDRGPAVEDTMSPHAGESFEGKTGTQEISGR
jgi:NADH-quinone oxidoreductase subunit C